MKMSLLVTRTIHSKKDKPYLLLFNKFSIAKAFLQFNEYLKEGGTILAVIVNKTEGRYVVASRAIVEDKSLSMKDRGLLLTLISLPPVWNFTVSGIASILPDGYDAVNAGINRLIKAGYVRRTQVREDGKFSDVKLEVYDTPFRDFPQTDNPVTEKPATRKPLTENQEQLNNNILNTNILNINQSNTKGCANSTVKVSIDGRKKQPRDGTVHGWSEAEKDLYGI